jgi:hypothetical protein
MSVDDVVADLVIEGVAAIVAVIFDEVVWTCDVVGVAVEVEDRCWC